MNLSVQPVKTRVFNVGEDLAAFILEAVPQVEEGSVICITSKIVSLAERRLVPREAIEKQALVRQEADRFYGEIGHGCFLTIKHGLLIPSAGIDESNSAGGDYILYPEDPFASAKSLWLELRERWSVDALGVILTDSRTTPLRRGVTGVCLSYWGFLGLKNLMGTPDLFGRELRMTQMNLADGLAASAVMLMGEGSESTPLTLTSGAQLVFTAQSDRDQLEIPLEEDLYYPILKACEARAD